MCGDKGSIVCAVPGRLEKQVYRVTSTVTEIAVGGMKERVPFRQDELFGPDRSSIGTRLPAMFYTSESQVTCYD